MNVLVIYGGRSGEHEISLISASAIVRGINKNHKVSLIGITKDGKWYLQDDSEYKRICDDKKATLTINIEKLPNQKAWLGKKVGDVLKTTSATLSYYVKRIYKE